MLEWFVCSWALPNKLHLLYEAWSMDLESPRVESRGGSHFWPSSGNV